MRNYLKYLIICILSGVIITALIYNFDLFIDLLKRLYDKQTLTHILATFFYFILYRTIKQKSNISPFLIFLFCIICPILIDASTLFTAPNLVPARFPFASLFPIIGCYLGYLSFSERKIRFISAILLACTLFYFTDRIFLPKIYYYQTIRDSPPFNHDVSDFLFYTVDGDGIKIKDTIRSEYAIIECFFIGCLPCEEKKEVLNVLLDSVKHEKLQVVYICNGKISTENDFKMYATKNQRNGAVFLYDRDHTLNTKFELTIYPFEIFLTKNQYTSSLQGYTHMIKKDYLINKFEKLK